MDGTRLPWLCARGEDEGCSDRQVGLGGSALERSLNLEVPLWKEQVYALF